MRFPGRCSVLGGLATLLVIAVSGPAAAAASTNSPSPVGIAHRAAVPPELTWSTPLAATDSGSQSLSCATAKFCVTIDEDSNAYVFNGTQWGPAVSLQDTAADFWHVSCPTPKFCAAVSDRGYVSYYRNGLWSAAAQVEVYGMSAVSCASTTFCVAGSTNTANGDEVYVYNGSTWGSAVPINPDGIDGFYGISCPSVIFCAAVDGNGQAIVYNGTTWGTPETIDATAMPLSVSCTTAKFCAAVDNYGRLIAYNGTAWRKPVKIDGTNELPAVACAGATFCIAADQNGNIVQTQGTAIEHKQNIANFDYAYTASCPSTSFCMAMNSGSLEVTGRS